MFKPSHELTFDTVQLDRKKLLQYIQTMIESVVCLDLSHVRLCDSAGLALLIDAKRMCRQYNKQFKLIGMPEVICALAEFCGVKAILINDNE